MKKTLALLLAVLLLPSLVFGFVQRNATHTIIGHGSVKGDLFIPYAAQMDQYNFYVLDQEGLTTFSRETGEAISKFRVETGLPELLSSFFTFVHDWALKDDLEVLPFEFNAQDLLALFNLNMFIEGDYAYIHGIKGIQQYELSSGKKLKTIPFPAYPGKTEDSHYLFFKPQLHENLMYYLAFDTEDLMNIINNPPDNFTLIQYHLDTNECSQLELQIPIPEGMEEYYSAMPYGFAVSEEGQLGVLMASNLGIELQCYDPQGAFISSYVVLDPYSDEMILRLPTSLAYLDVKQIALSIFKLTMDSEDYSMSISHEIETIQLHENILEKSSTYAFTDAGFFPLRLSAYRGDMLLIQSGSFDALINFSVTHLSQDPENKEIILNGQVGKSPYGPGQVFGSLAFTVDDEGRLYQNNLGMNTIQVFNPDGSFAEEISINNPLAEDELLKEAGIQLPCILTQLVIQGDTLYTIDLFGFVQSYSLSNQSWTLLSDQDFYDIPSFYLDAKCSEEGLHVFEPYSFYDAPPSIKTYHLNGEVDYLELEYDFSLYKDKPNITLSFTLNDTEFHLLDSLHRKILIFDRMDGRLIKEVVIFGLPILATSIDLHPEKEYAWLVNDLTTQSLYGIHRNGIMMHRIGKKQVLSSRLTPEDYKEKKDGFYIPLRIQTKAGKIYVLDFLNCRFHRIVLGSQEE
jgi:hypothetical protein